MFGSIKKLFRTIKLRHLCAELRDGSALQPYPDCLSDPSEDCDSPSVEMRLHAVRGLAEMIDERAFLSLKGALNDSDPRVQEAAAEGLGKLRDPRAVVALSELLNDNAKNAVCRPATLARSLDPTTVARALAEIGDVHAIEALIGALGHSDRVRIIALEAVADSAHQRAVELLVSAANSKSDSVRKCAVKSLLKIDADLGKLGDSRALKSLVSSLRYR